MPHSTDPGAPGRDPLLTTLAGYASSALVLPEATLSTAMLALLDAVGCAAGGLQDPDCRRLLGPLVPGTVVPQGVPVWLTGEVLDPVKAAFDISAMVRWLDFSDTTTSGGHPSDNLGALFAAAHHAGPARAARGLAAYTLRDMAAAMAKAYEIQGLLAVANRFDHPSIGLDHVVGVKLASAAVATQLLGGGVEQVANALSNAFLDGQALNAYRHVPNAGTRKGWAGPDASARGLALALMAVRGEMGYPRPLSAPEWGFEAVHLQGRPLRLEAAPGTGVMDQLIFKLYPAQRNATTAVECALRLHAWLAGRVAQVRQVRVFTQDEAMRRIDKTGPLPNRAARDHSMQYIVASVLLRGRLQAEDYADEAAADPRLDALRARVVVREDAGYTRDHHDPRVLSCANAIEIELDDGTCSPRVEVLYPPGDVQRRAEALPALEKKFDALTQRLDPAYRDRLRALFSDTGALLAMPVSSFMALLSRNPA